jgi:hypothetical protein
LYICRFIDGQLNAEWQTGDSQTNTVIVHDFDKNGINEFYYNDGHRISGYVLDIGKRPVPPASFTAVPRDTGAIRLSWYSPENHDAFLIYRGKDASNLTVIDSIGSGESFIDSVVVKDTTYFYAVKARNYTYQINTSALSRVRSAKPNNPPQIDSLVVINKNQVQIYFNEQMDKSSFLPENFHLMPGMIYPGSVLSAFNGQACLVTFSDSFIDQTLYEINMSGVRDNDRTGLQEEYDNVVFYYQDLGDQPYIEKHLFSANNQLDLFFNMPMDRMTLLNIENYRISPGGTVTDAEMIGSDDRIVRIHLGSDVYTGASGIASYLELQEIKSVQGRLFATGNRISLAREPEDLDNIFVYPQPVRSEMDWIGFANVAPATRIDIFDISGYKVVTLYENNGFGGIRWNMQNGQGKRVAAGIYIFYARNGDETKMGKFTILK